MRLNNLNQLLAIARRESGANLAEDVVQEALVIAVEAGRLNPNDPDTAHWLRGVVRNRARMAARADRRRIKRESVWEVTRRQPAPPDDATLPEILSGLSPALRGLAALVLTGHNRREIAYLLNLSDTALRKRVSDLKHILISRNLVAPSELKGLNLDLAYGKIRNALVPALHRHGGSFASHDPDGHLFVVRRSQNTVRRQ